MSDKPTCPICGHDIADTAYVCHPCARRMAKRLLRVARIWPAVEAACGRLGRRTVAGAGRDVASVLAGPSCEDCGHESCQDARLSQDLAELRAHRDALAEHPLAHEDGGPVDPAAIEAKDVAANTVGTWARHVCETRTIETPASIRAALVFLAKQADWLAHRREAEEAFDELTAACQKAEGAVDNLGVDLAFSGPCDVCGRDLYAPAGAEDAYCRPCDLMYPLDARRAHLAEQVDSQLMPAGELAAALNTTGSRVTRELIRNWATRGRLQPRGHDARGHRLYAVRDVRELVASRDFRLARATRRRVRKLAP